VEQNDSLISSLNGNKRISEPIECFVSTADFIRPKKRTKVEDLSTVTLGYIQNKNPLKENAKHRLRVLFDSGCGATLINKRFVRHWKKTMGKPVKWSTKAGSFKTRKRCEIEFTLPAFHENRTVSCNAYVDESPHERNNHDIIIGRDLMHSMGINLLFDTAQITWDNATVPMRPPDRLTGDWVDTLEKEILFAHDPATTDAERIQQIIDAKYTPADLDKIVEECTHLTKEEQNKLLQLLKKFENLFDGTLGTWNTTPVDLELKDPNVKPYHAKPYPVPYSQEKQLKEEIKRMCDYGVMRKINDSELACPLFTISKPDGSLRSLAYFKRIKQGN